MERLSSQQILDTGLMGGRKLARLYARHTVHDYTVAARRARRISPWIRTLTVCSGRTH